MSLKAMDVNQKHFSSLRSIINKQDGEIVKLKKENEQLAGKINYLIKNRLEGNNDFFKAVVRKIEEKVNEKNADLEVRISKLEIDNLDLKKENKKLRKENETLNTTNIELQKQLNDEEQLREHIENLQLVNIEANKQLTQLLKAHGVRDLRIALDKQRYPGEFFVGFWLDIPRFFKSFENLFSYYFSKSNEKKKEKENLIKDIKATIDGGKTLLKLTKAIGKK
ncbi:MAG: hypothetical protein AMS24_03690 [Chlamydiae bacterium SM23_39]|nr:MAG: hypothetical protein AMS24_03690 [Chlamydiae bacterium SM23_39]